MLIILEGSNGVGKSTYAKELSKVFDIPQIRPFRDGNSDLHWGHAGKDKFDQLRKLKVPVNTHVDDLYTADFLATCKVGAILDRSVPSSIAYGYLNGDNEGWLTEPGVPKTLLEFWLGMIMKIPGPILYVWLRAPYAVAKKRCADRWCPKSAEYKELEKIFFKIFQTLSIPKMQISTQTVFAEDGIKSIITKLAR